MDNGVLYAVIMMLVAFILGMVAGVRLSRPIPRK